MAEFEAWSFISRCMDNGGRGTVGCLCLCHWSLFVNMYVVLVVVVVVLMQRICSCWGWSDEFDGDLGIWRFGLH